MKRKKVFPKRIQTRVIGTMTLPFYHWPQHICPFHFENKIINNHYLNEQKMRGMLVKTQWDVNKCYYKWFFFIALAPGIESDRYLTTNLAFGRSDLEGERTSICVMTLSILFDRLSSSNLVWFIIFVRLIFLGPRLFLQYNLLPKTLFPSITILPWFKN